MQRPNPIPKIIDIGGIWVYDSEEDGYKSVDVPYIFPFSKITDGSVAEKAITKASKELKFKEEMDEVLNER